MSKITNIGTALITALYETNTKQEQLANEMKSTQASISRIISGKNRPTRATIHAMCCALKKSNYNQAVSVLIGHLKDEIEASGMLQSDIDIHPANRKQPTRVDIERNLDCVRNAALKSKQTAALLADLAWLIEQSNYSEIQTELKAAETGPAYNYAPIGNKANKK